jgi:hypothetical protein
VAHWEHYIWNKFRQIKRFRAYSEPLHEALAGSRTELSQAWSLEINRRLRHPDTDEFYFAEYPFRAEGGVHHFQVDFAYQRYILEEIEAYPSLEHYNNTLLCLARTHQQRPVLQFNRGLLRTGWLAKHFPSVTILILRDPRQIWRSFISFEDLYFPAVLCLIIGQNQTHPLIAPIARQFDVPVCHSESFQEDFEFFEAFAVSRLRDLYPLFYRFYILCSLHSIRYAQCVIDVDKLSSDEEAQAVLSSGLNSYQININLSDCRAPARPDQTSSAAWRDQEEACEEALKQDCPSSIKVPQLCLETHRASLTQHWEELFIKFLKS